MQQFVCKNLTSKRRLNNGGHFVPTPIGLCDVSHLIVCHSHIKCDSLKYQAKEHLLGIQLIRSNLDSEYNIVIFF